MSLLSFCVCETCRKRGGFGVRDRKTGERGRERFFFFYKPGKGHCKMLSICQTQLAACFQREEGRKLVFSCNVCASSDSTSSLKAQRESSCRIARTSFL